MTVEWVRPAREERPGGGVLRRRMILEASATDHDPFLLWGEDWFEQGAFGWHPHRGFESASYLIDGELHYELSTGSGGTLTPGDVLWTTAGSGIYHMADPISKTAHGLQLWINLPARHKMCPPREDRIRPHEAPTVGDDRFLARVYAGSVQDVTGPAPAVTDASFMALEFKDGSLDVPVPEGQYGTLVVLEGLLEVDGQAVASGHVARVSGEIHCEAQRPGLALFIMGTPIQEPVVMGGPFVMNTAQEIEQAHADAKAGVIPAPKA